jgi:aminopeptidase
MSLFFHSDPRLHRWAQIIVEFCTEVKPGDRVEITGEVEGHPLMLALFQSCLMKGAHPVLRPSFDESSELFYRYASDEQLKYVHPIAEIEAKQTDVSLHVLAECNTKALTDIDPEKIAKVRRARQEIAKIRKERIRWNVTSYPTNAYAQDAGMSLTEFTEFIFTAGFLNHEDALLRWKKLRARQQKLTQLLNNTKTLRIESPGCDLTLGVENRIICESSGKVNMPDGEIYTGPVEDKVNGWIRFSFPGYYMGQIVEGIFLEFKDGEVIKASAATNEQFLHSMLKTDPGARRLGEIGIGTNWNIQRFTQNLLFDEKIGGTVHLALGDAYRETLGLNRSAIHWDILHDLRHEGRIYADDNVLLENGLFTGKYAELWANEK